MISKLLLLKDRMDDVKKMVYQNKVWYGSYDPHHTKVYILHKNISQ